MMKSKNKLIAILIILVTLTCAAIPLYVIYARNTAQEPLIAVETDVVRITRDGNQTHITTLETGTTHTFTLRRVRWPKRSHITAQRTAGNEHILIATQGRILVVIERQTGKVHII